MTVKKSGARLTVYRYGGTVDGKSLEVKVASVDSGILPAAIPPDVTDLLTPRELGQLKAALEEQARSVQAAKAIALTNGIDEILVAAESGWLEVAEIQKLSVAASRFQRRIRRVEAAQNKHNAAATSAETDPRGYCKTLTDSSPKDDFVGKS